MDISTHSDVEAVAAREVARREAVTNPPPRDFPSEVDEGYFGVSTLTKISAEAYTKKILEQADSHVPAYYGFRGNALGDEALRPITPHRELSVRVDNIVMGDWALMGHPDGLSISDGVLIVDEAKSHLYPDDDKFDIASRQAMLYAALVHLSKGKTLPTSPLSDDDCEPLTIPEDLHEGAIIIIDMVSAHEAQHPARHADDDDLQQTLDFYTRKASAILQSVRDGNLDAARAWDRSPDGLTEFTRHVPEAFDGPDASALESLVESKAEADMAYKTGGDTRKSTQAEILAIMREQGIEECVVGNHAIKVVGGFDGPRSPHIRIKELS